MDEKKKRTVSRLVDKAGAKMLSETEDYIFTLDTDLIYRAASDSVARLTGLSAAEELVGKNDLEIFPRELAEKYRADDLEVLRTGVPMEGVLERLPDRDGTERWTKTWKTPVRDDDGALLGLFCLSRDMTRVVSLEAAAESGRRFRDLVGRLPGGVCIVHQAKGNFILDFANEGWARAHHLSARSAQDQVGKSLMDGIFPEDRQMLLQKFEWVDREDGRQGSAVYRVFGEDGKTHWVGNQFCFAYEESGTRYYYVAYTDMDEQRQAVERLRSERIKLKALEGDTFEAFSFNITKNSAPDLETRDTGMDSAVVSDELTRDALRISPPLERTNADTRGVLLRAASRIPDREEREQFIAACSGDAMRKAAAAGRYSREMRYRRYVNGTVRWVSSRAEILPDPETGDLIAFYYTSDVSSQVIEEKLSSRIMDRNYETVSYFDLQSGAIRILRTRDPRDAALDGKEYSAAVDGAAERVAPAQLEEFRAKTAPKRILDELEKNPVYTFYYAAGQTREDLPGRPLRQMKSDVFYLDEHRDILVFLLADVTEIFEQERENRTQMADALTAAKQASAAKSNFLSRMSHEIRTPLNAIIGMDTIAAQSVDKPEAVANCISKIGLSARYLLSLINDILDMSRIESGKMLLKNETFLFSEFIAGVNNIIYPQVRSKGLDYECTVSGDVDDSYVGDEMKLQQILVNVLGNAVKFTERGKVTLDVSVSARTGNRVKLRFVVGDTGCGIAEEDLGRIFDAFEQVDTSTTSVFGGTGLGLAITKNLAGLMGGAVTARSIVGVGSEFTVDIPLTTDETAVIPQRYPINLRDLKTLIVDDDLFICEQTEAILREIGMRSEWVTTGQEAVGRVRKQFGAGAYYDFILIDWKMPDMDGIETTQQIRSIVGPDVTIIIISAYDWQSIETEARAAGANLMISKPLLKSTLVSAFEKALGGEKPAEEAKPEFDFTGRRVLVAEDNELNAEIARTLLESKHFTVETAPNGIKALEKFAKSPVGWYDAILMDVRMPMMDGLQATVNIRHWNKEDAAAVPIIAMTANAFDEDVEKSRAAGMNAHLSKPIDPDLMYSTLFRLLDKNS